MKNPNPLLLLPIKDVMEVGDIKLVIKAITKNDSNILNKFE